MSDDQAQALEPSTGSDDARLAELARLAGQMHDDPLRPPETEPDPGAGVITENTRWLPAGQDPAFCWQCGKALSHQESMLPQGFNTLTGERLPDKRHVSRSCMHVTWVMTETGGWLRI